MEREQATKFIYDLLRALVSKKGSDLFITAGYPPAMKIDGRMTPVSQQPLTSQHTAMLVRSAMNDRQAAEFEANKECNFAIAPATIGRFRVNCFVQMGCVGMVLRVITTTIPSFDDLKLPPVLKEVAMTKRGLVIFVGATGSGKSTSLAAMIGYRNENSHGHIVTIEDPVEFVHPHKNCMITQREVGVDTDSWEAALKNTLRQAPDVLHHLAVADLADQDHVGGLPQGVLERRFPGVGVHAHFALRDHAVLVRVHELDRVLDGDDVAVAVFVAVADHRGERGRFARAGGADEDHEAALGHRDLLQHRRQLQVVEARNAGRDHAQHHADAAHL